VATESARRRTAGPKPASGRRRTTRTEVVKNPKKRREEKTAERQKALSRPRSPPPARWGEKKEGVLTHGKTREGTLSSARERLRKGKHLAQRKKSHVRRSAVRTRNPGTTSSGGMYQKRGPEVSAKKKSMKSLVRAVEECPRIRSSMDRYDLGKGGSGGESTGKEKIPREKKKSKGEACSTESLKPSTIRMTTGSPNSYSGKIKTTSGRAGGETWG